MAEFKLGRIRFVWKGEWAAATQYYKDDVIRYGGKTFICVTGHVSDTNFYTDRDFSPTRWNQMSDGTEWAGVWTVSTFYKINDLVNYGGTVYICNESHTSAGTTALGLEADLAKWDIFAEGFDWKGSWATSTRYKINDLVRYGGYTYVCNEGHISAATATLGLEDDQSKWDTFNPGLEYKGAWSGSSVRYKLNDVVKYGAGLWACTADHTSTATFSDDEANWSLMVEGAEFEGDWNNSTVYQPGDIVRYGGYQYIAKTNHVGSNPRTETTDWDLFSQGFRFQNDWSSSTAYKIGEVVRLNGYTYLATTDVPVLTQTVTNSSAATNRFTVTDTTGILAGMMVKFSGTTFGDVFTNATYYIQSVPSATTFTIAATPGGTVITPTTASGTMTATITARPTNANYWARLNSGVRWQGAWADDVEYVEGDVVRYGANAYICILAHRSEADDGSTVRAAGGGQDNSRPDQDVTGTYWNVLTIGNEESVLTTRGDLVYYGGAGPTRLPVGLEGQVLSVSETNIPEWVTLGKTDYVYYVANHGTDEPAPIFGLTVDKPWASIRYACEQVLKGPRNPNAARLIELNRQFVQRETTRWIDYQIANNIAPFATSFDYDEHKCERDVGIIIDALLYDITHGGNEESRKCALAYVQDAPNFYTLEQEPETVAALLYAWSVMGKVLEQDTPDTIYQNITDDSSAIVTQYFQADIAAETGVYDTITSLMLMITGAITDGTADNIPARYRPNNLISVKTGQYREVLPIIVPAETCVQGDELRSTNAGPAGSKTSKYDTKYSLETLGRMEAIIGDIITGTSVTPTSGNTETQVQLWPYGDTPEVDHAELLMRAIRHKIDFKVGNMDLASYPDPTNYNTSYLIGYGDARKLIKENKLRFQAEVTAYVDRVFPEVHYSRTKCRQDVGYIIDALVYDLTYGGNSMSVQAGLAYFDGAGGALQIDSEELTATLGAMAYLKTMVTDAAQDAIWGGEQTAIRQYRDTAGSAAAASLVSDNIDIIIDIITNGTTGAPNITVTEIASGTTLTSVGHGLDVQDKFIPRASANGLVKDRVYYVVAVPSADTFTISASWGGSAVSSLTNGTGLDIDADVVDTADTAAWPTAMKTAFAALSAAQETIIQDVIDDLNAVAWHTDFVVDSTSLTSTEFRVYVGKTDLAHTYVSGGKVTKSNGTELDITNFVYNESTGYAVVTTATHGLAAGDIVDITNITVSCLSQGTAYTAIFPNSISTDGSVTKVAYLQNKCIRDIRIILDAVGYDFMANGNFQTTKAAYSYLRASAAEVYTLGQKQVTRDAFAAVKTAAKANVGGDTTAQSRIESLMVLLDAVVYGHTNEGSNQKTRERNAHNAARIIELNRDFIVAEIDAYISDTFIGTATATASGTNIITVDSTVWMQRGTALRFTGTTLGGIETGVTYYVSKIVSSTEIQITDERFGDVVTLTSDSGSMGVEMHYNSALCLRDVNTYIDAVKYDLTRPGNYRSMLAARYYVNSVLGSFEEDMYYLRNATGLRDQTCEGLRGDLGPLNEYGSRRVTAGAYASLDPGWGPDDESVWITSRSPYVQGLTTFGTACIGQKVDGDLHNGGNKSITSNDFTQVLSDGIGAWITNNARAELVSVFTYYNHIGYLAENGGRIRGTNGNNSYGDFGSVAEGFDDTEIPNTAIVDNKFQFDASVGTVFTDGNQLLGFEFINAGQNYTEATWTILGPGLNGTPEQDEFRDGAVFEVRLLDLGNDSSGQFGGEGYLSNSNTSQGGTSTSITLAATDSELSSAYVGMKVVLTGGTGAGQYGIITSYNAGTKLANVVKETTGASGWDHMVPGSTISSPDASTTYTVEPRISFTAPAFSSTSRTLSEILEFVDVTYGQIVRSYIGVTGTSDSAGTGATFDVLRNGNNYTVTINSAGTGYERLDEIVLAGTDLGGASPTNDITVTITSINAITGAITAIDTDGEGAGGHYVAIATGTDKTVISPSGTTWIDGGALPSSTTWTAVAGGRITATATAGAFVVGRSYTITDLGTIGSQTDFKLIGALNNNIGTTFVATGVGTGTGTATPNQSVFVAVASGGTTTARSVDGGITWTAGGALPSSGSWNCLAYAKGIFVTLRSGSANVAYSIDGGATWAAGGALPASATWTSVAYGRGRWVAVASGGTQAAYSLDNGATWTTATLPQSSNWNSVSWGNGRFVAISSTSGTIAAYSLDGVTWTSSTLPATAAWTKISYGQGVFLAVSQTTQAASSEDGIVWTSRTLATSTNGYAKAVHGNSNRTPLWVAVQRGTSGNVACSTVLGTQARGRAYVAQEKIFRVLITEPGSAYASAPTMTITDPNNIYEMPFEVRIGDGAMANPSFVNRGSNWISANAELFSGDGYADFFQPGTFVAVRRITQRPVAGSNIVFGNLPDRTFKLVNVLTFRGQIDGSYTAFFQISPPLEISEAPLHGESVTTRIRYSQVRLTGHDFLDIGTGNFEETNYPGVPTQDAVQANETQEGNGGRVFFTSTDQDGNFRVGDLFTIEQSTGIATLNADAFNIAGLQELSLGEVTLGGASASINEFSTDPFFTADSDSVVPTQRAIKAYISAQIGGGGASLNVNSLTAGFVFINTNQITTTTGSAILMNARFDFRAGVTGYPLAFNYFLNK
jgi:hypothetical protein